MAHNKLRRDLAAAVVSGCPNIADNTAIQSLLKRALDALGGPVEDKRPVFSSTVPEATGAPTSVMVAAAVAGGCESVTIAGQDQEPNWGMYQASDGTPPRDEARPGLGESFIPPPGRLDLADPDPTTVVTRPGPFGCTCYPWNGIHAVGCPRA